MDIKEELIHRMKRGVKHYVYFIIIISVISGYFLLKFKFEGQDAPACSSEQVVESVKSIAKEQIEKSPKWGIIADPKGTSYELDAIRTVNQGEKKSECKAELNIEIHMAKIKASNPVIYSMIAANGYNDQTNPTHQFNLDYSAQDTDDGKSVYVEVEGFLD